MNFRAHIARVRWRRALRRASRCAPETDGNAAGLSRSSSSSSSSSSAAPAPAPGRLATTSTVDDDGIHRIHRTRRRHRTCDRAHGSSSVVTVRRRVTPQCALGARRARPRNDIIARALERARATRIFVSHDDVDDDARDTNKEDDDEETTTMMTTTTTTMRMMSDGTSTDTRRRGASFNTSANRFDARRITTSCACRTCANSST